MHYYGFRYYSPELGRWINRDPIGERGGKHLYSFIQNKALNGYDILGLRVGGGGNIFELLDQLLIMWLENQTITAEMIEEYGDYPRCGQCETPKIKEVHIIKEYVGVTHSVILNATNTPDPTQTVTVLKKQTTTTTYQCCPVRPFMWTFGQNPRGTTTVRNSEADSNSSRINIGTHTITERTFTKYITEITPYRCL